MSTPEPTAVSGIGQIAVNTHDLARAVRFYRDTLGLRFLFEAPKLAFFDAGGVRLMLGPPEGAEHDHPASVVYYRVADIQGAAGRLKQGGAECVGEPHFIAKLPDHDLWMAFFKDTEGNTFALMSELRGG
jgi:methylmalonyl-CoA/ethylmalonyl-CoA epimerase